MFNGKETEQLEQDLPLYTKKILDKPVMRSLVLKHFFLSRLYLYAARTQKVRITEPDYSDYEGYRRIETERIEVRRPNNETQDHFNSHFCIRDITV